MFSSVLEASEITTEIIEQARESVVLLQVSTIENPGITTPTATCAGAVIDKEGHIVTNYHCVHNQKSIRLYYYDDEEWGGNLFMLKAMECVRKYETLPSFFMKMPEIKKNGGEDNSTNSLREESLPDQNKELERTPQEPNTLNF